MGNSITRTVLFAASALLSMSAFGAGAARFGTLRNSDWVVTNAWQAVSNKTHDLILEIGHGDSLPPDWQNVSNAAVNAVQSLQPAYDYTDTKISTNNSAFVSAVLAAPLVGADPNDLSELAEYGSYGTVGAAILAFIAGLAALKRRMTSAETSKLDGAAAYPAWISTNYQPPAIVSHKGRLWSCQNYTVGEPGVDEPLTDWLEVTIEDLKQDALSYEQSLAVNSGVTAAKVLTWDGYAEQIALKANASDLPYAMVTPGEWEFSGSDVQSGHTYTIDTEKVGEHYLYLLKDNGTQISQATVGEDFETEIDFGAIGDPSVDIVATVVGDSLPGHLLDRAVNAVSVSTDTTLTLPALVNAGKARDFLVRLEISGSTVPTITFAAPTGETITYETDGDEFPVPDEAGTWLYSFTESCVAHKFAVSLKKVNTVAAPQAQGGS